MILCLSLSWAVPEDAGLLCDKVAVLGTSIKETQFYVEWTYITVRRAINA